MKEKTYRIYGRFGENISSSFNDSYTAEMKDANLRVDCSDITGTNKYIDVHIIPNEPIDNFDEYIEVQLVDGFFEGLKFGKVEELDENGNVVNTLFKNLE